MTLRTISLFDLGFEVGSLYQLRVLYDDRGNILSHCVDVGK